MASDIKKTLEVFDFRLDSRKQAKWLRLFASVKHSDILFNTRKEEVQRMNKLKNHGYTYKEIAKKTNGFSNKCLEANYIPQYRIKILELETRATTVSLPIISIENLGYNTVYDFTVQHKDHSIIANDIIAHNCLQRLHYRLVETSNKSNTFELNMNSHWRSRDLAGAWFMNTFAIVHLQQMVVDKLNEQINATNKYQVFADKYVTIGQYVDICDSLHIYEKDLDRIIDVATKIVSAKSTNNYRYWSTDEEPVATIIEEATQNIAKRYNIDKPKTWR
jgi:thymidylate synthase